MNDHSNHHPTQSISIILPAKNEAAKLKSLLQKLQQTCPQAEIILVDDGSTDDTPAIASELGIHLVSRPYSMGNGAAVKAGARAASGDILVFMDADGQHDPADIPRLLAKLDAGYDMAVGARSRSSQASMGRNLANGFYNRLASYMSNHRVEDLTSGFRAVQASKFREFLYLLPNGFSYPTTITMAFFRAGHAICYVPIIAAKRVGSSHINPVKDGIRFLLIIFKVGSLYSPLKLFAPISLAFFLTGGSYYLFTFFTVGRFTNMSALLLSTSILVFLIGLVSEQITALMYKDP
jgi:glycosyltransferase involved in cell wall biosynthesis